MAKIADSDLILNNDGSIYHLNLLPKHVSDTVIGVGDPGRVYEVSKYFDEVEFEMNKREFITHVGRYNGKRVTVISTGIGTDNVEIFFSELDALVNIDLKTREPKARRRKLKIIRIGTCGALQEDIAVGSYVLTDYAVGLDNLMNFYDLSMDDKEAGIAHDLQRKTGIPFMPYVVRGSEALHQQLKPEFQSGNTVTCPGFYAPQGRILRMPVRFPKLLEDLNYYHKDDFWLSNFEMETAAYYALGRMMGHEVQSVSAVLANRIKNRVAKNPAKVVDGLIKKVLDRL
jgi:uridine phosphorylase